MSSGENLVGSVNLRDIGATSCAVNRQILHDTSHPPLPRGPPLKVPFSITLLTPPRNVLFSQDNNNNGQLPSRYSQNPPQPPQQPGMYGQPNNMARPTPPANNMYGQQQQQQQFQQPPASANADWFNAPQPTSTQQPVPSTFDPSAFQGQMNTAAPSLATASGEEDYYNEPPLLEELGVNIPHIIEKTKAVLHPLKAHDPSLVDDTDLAGPLAFALLLGVTLGLQGKLHFGYIYGFGVFGCLAMSFLVNLMSSSSIDTWVTMSILGYSLLPINGLALLAVFLNLTGYFGLLCSTLTILWSTAAATRLIERCCNMQDQRWLVAYPVALLYSCFVMLTIF